MTDKSDRNFDDLAQRFSRTIYTTARGKLRLLALEKDFSESNIELDGAQVLDLGGGQGQFSLSLAQQGAHISLCDISQEMLTLAQDQFNQAQQPLIAHQCRLQDAANFFPNTYDIVLNHAVLEWLESPFDALPLLTQRVRTGGVLSVMFYNLYGHQWRQLMNGRTHAPNGANQRLRDEGNAPQHPLDPDAIQQALEAEGFELLRWRGIRCIHDHMHQKIRERIGQDAVNLADLEAGLQEPYRRLGRYVHLLMRKIG
ncbi:MAG: methyltransferase domain-containing protein [Oleibacter sp.]|nr:methyltransferase domain-containing protein [Thalassolituus sp.]